MDLLEVVEKLSADVGFLRESVASLEINLQNAQSSLQGNLSAISDGLQGAQAVLISQLSSLTKELQKAQVLVEDGLTQSSNMQYWDLVSGIINNGLDLVILSSVLYLSYKQYYRADNTITSVQHDTSKDRRVSGTSSLLTQFEQQRKPTELEIVNDNSHHSSNQKNRLSIT